MYRAVFILLGLALAHTALAAEMFRRPPGPGPTDDYTDNPIYALGQKITFVWESDYTVFDIILWNNKLDPKTGYSPYTRILQRWTSKQFTWEVSYSAFSADADLSLPVFYLALYQSGNTSVAFTSHYFNVTSAATTSSSTGAVPSATSPAVATLSSPTSTPTTAPAPAETGSVSQQAEVGISGGTAAGIAVGITLGAILILSGLGYFLWRRHSRAKQGAMSHNNTIVMETTEYSRQPYAAEPPQPYTADWKIARPLETAELENATARTPEAVELEHSSRRD